MDRSESLKMLEAWIYDVVLNIPNSKIYWEVTVRKGKKLGEWTDWENHGVNIGLNKKGYFASNDMQYVGYVDPNNPVNSYFVSIYPYLSDTKGIYLKLPLSEFSLNPQATWVSAEQHKINPDGTHTYVWGGSTLYDISDLVLGNPARFKFVNWNKTPFRVK